MTNWVTITTSTKHDIGGQRVAERLGVALQNDGRPMIDAAALPSPEVDSRWLGPRRPMRQLPARHALKRVMPARICRRARELRRIRRRKHGEEQDDALRRWSSNRPRR